MKKVFPLLTLLTFSLIPLANEFWIQPEKFIYKWNETINIRFYTGDDFEEIKKDDGSSRIDALVIYFDDVKDDMSDYITDEKGDSIQLKLLNEGTAQVVYSSKNIKLKMEPAEFNTYQLKRELSEILAYRKRRNELDSSGNFYHQQCAKTIFQVGNRYNNTYKLETSAPLDFIPQQNPYNLNDADSLEVKILFQNEPLANHLIRIKQKLDLKIFQFSLYSDKMGIIKIPVASYGVWMLNATIIEKLPIDNNSVSSETRWQSFTGSLTWGYQ